MTMNALLNVDVIASAVLQEAKEYARWVRHPFYRRGLSRSHRRKLLKQRRIHPCVRIHQAPKLATLTTNETTG